jgi:DNA-binding response OmpR family regulator
MSSPKTVIIAEPDPLISGVLRVEFSRRDFSVYMAASGPEAEDYAARTMADLIVLDAGLHLDAFDACARIRRRPEYTRRPIVLTTARPTSRVQAAAGAAGVTFILVKPYSVGDLFSAIRPYVPSDGLLPTGHGLGARLDQPRDRTATPQQQSQSGLQGPSIQIRPFVPVIGGKGVLIPLVRKLRS